MHNTILVCSLFDMPHYVESLAPQRLISIIQPELQPDRPAEITSEQHLRVAVHDIVAPRDYGVLADQAHMERLVQFIDQWQPETGGLLVHCYAGVSRSTAVALIACFMKTRDAGVSATALRAAAPHAKPNRHLLDLADQVLQTNGVLADAASLMGPATTEVFEGPLTRLKIPQ